MNDLPKAIITQATSDVLTIYGSVRETLGDVPQDQRDIVAATLTHAILTRMTQVAESLG